jgi:hypothetical protein
MLKNENILLLTFSSFPKYKTKQIVNLMKNKEICELLLRNVTYASIYSSFGVSNHIM